MKAIFLKVYHARSVARFCWTLPYMKWTLKAERTTPRHMLHEETGRYRMEVRTGGRAVKYERKIEQAKKNTLRNECWRLIKKENGKTEREKKRKEYYKKKRMGAERSKQKDRGGNRNRKRDEAEKRRHRKTRKNK